MIDLLVERAEFGHGGNQEVIKPIAALSDVQVLLITPQMQSFDAGYKVQAEAEVERRPSRRGASHLEIRTPRASAESKV